MAFWTALAVTALAAATAYSAISQQSQAKAAKSAADTQSRMVAASTDALIASEEKARADLTTKEAKATADVKSAQEKSASQAKESVTQKKKAIARSETIYTSPLGIGGTAEVSRKILLGQ